MADVGINPGAWTDPRMMLAQQLMQSSTDASPVRSWTQELARALAGPVGAYEATKVRDDRTQALTDIYGNPTGAASGAAANQPGLLARIGHSLFGSSTMGDQPQPNTSNPNLVAAAGSPLAQQLDSSAPSVSSGGSTYGAKFTQPPSGSPSTPQNAVPTSGAPVGPGTMQAATSGAPQASPMAGGLAQQMYIAHRMMQVGREQNQPDLVQQGAAILQNIQQKQAEAQIEASGGLLKDGYILGPDGKTVTALGGKGEIDAANAAAKDSAENPALISRAGGISHAERGDKIAEALAPAQFALQTTTQTVQTPGGPRLMTNAQAMDYARTGVLPGAGATDNGTAATGALQDPKVKEAQIAEVTGSQKRFSDAQGRLQNLIQLKSILANPNLLTGAQGDELQTARGTILQAYTALGKTPPPELVSGVASGEALKAAANNLAIEVSKDEGVGTPRISIFNAISQNKPSLSSSPQGNLIRVLAMEQSAKRESDFGNFAASYYQQPGNYNKQDAESAFAKQNPNSKYVAEIYPKSAAEFAAIPIGGMFVGPDGMVHTKTPLPAAGPVQ